MATCRRVNIRMTTETTTTWERSVAVKQSEECPTPWLPDGLAPQPKTSKVQETAVEYRLELSEAEAREVLIRLDAFSCTSGNFCVQDALRAVLDGDKDFATRRPKGLSYGVNWKASPLSADGHYPNCSRSDRCAGEGTCRG